MHISASFPARPYNFFPLPTLCTKALASDILQSANNSDYVASMLRISARPVDVKHRSKLRHVFLSGFTDQEILAQSVRKCRGTIL